MLNKIMNDKEISGIIEHINDIINYFVSYIVSYFINFNFY